MNVHNGIESRLLRIACNLGHPVQPGCLDSIFRCIAYVPHPGHRYADGRESLGLQIVKSRLSAFLIAPVSLAGDSANHGIHLVSEIPAIAELPCQSYRIVVRQCRSVEERQIFLRSRLIDLQILLHVGTDN